MRIIVVTPESPRNDEAELSVAMLKMGVDRIHLRHPGCGVARLRNIIANIPLKFRSRVTLHDHFELVREFPDIGLNLNSRNSDIPAGAEGIVSRSCHTVDETFLPADYCLLSPVFPSISKSGYCHDFSEPELMSLPPGKVVALGGVTSERIPLLKRYPFAGVAVLGSVWTENTNKATVLSNIAAIIEQK